MGLQTTEEIADELREFIEQHFQRTTDATIYIHFTDFLDFIFENSEFNIQKVKRVLLLWNDLEIHNGRVYGLQCITEPQLNMETDEVYTSESSGTSDDEINSDDDDEN